MPVASLAPSSARSFRGRSPQSCFRGDRNPHHKGAPRSRLIVPALNFTAMRPHDAVTNAQSKPRALAHLLGCVKRIKYALWINNSRPIVADRHFDHLRLPPRMNLDSAALTCLLDRVVSIVEDIQKHLLQLLG